MALALSLTFALALLAFRLIVHSRILTADDETRRQRLINQLTIVTIVSLGIGCAMVIVGFVFSTLGNNFVSVGFTLMAISFMLLIQGESLKRTGNAAKSFGRTVNRYAWIFFWVVVVAIAILLVRLILAWTGVWK